MGETIRPVIFFNTVNLEFNTVNLELHFKVFKQLGAGVLAHTFQP